MSSHTHGHLARARAAALADLTQIQGATRPQWRIIHTDSESPTGLAPVCSGERSDSLHMIEDYPDGPARDEEGVYDCCPGPQIETYSPVWAAYLVELLNADGEKASATAPTATPSCPCTIPSDYTPEYHCVCREDPATGPAHEGHATWCPARKPTPKRISEIRQGIGDELTRDELAWLSGAAERHELHVAGARMGEWPMRDLPGAVLLLSGYLAAVVAVVERQRSTEVGEEATLETAPLTIYYAEHDSILMGRYTTAAAARKHCETEERRSWPAGTNLAFNWIEDEEDGAAELTVVAGQNEESITGYVVSALTVASEYDGKADE